MLFLKSYTVTHMGWRRPRLLTRVVCVCMYVCVYVLECKRGLLSLHTVPISLQHSYWIILISLIKLKNILWCFMTNESNIHVWNSDQYLHILIFLRFQIKIFYRNNLTYATIDIGCYNGLIREKISHILFTIVYKLIYELLDRLFN